MKSKVKIMKKKKAKLAPERQAVALPRLVLPHGILMGSTQSVKELSHISERGCIQLIPVACRCIAMALSFQMRPNLQSDTCVHQGSGEPVLPPAQSNFPKPKCPQPLQDIVHSQGCLVGRSLEMKSGMCSSFSGQNVIGQSPPTDNDY